MTFEIAVKYRLTHNAGCLFKLEIKSHEYRRAEFDLILCIKFVMICLTCNSMIIFLFTMLLIIYDNIVLLYSLYLMLNMNNIFTSFSFGLSMFGIISLRKLFLPLVYLCLNCVSRSHCSLVF